MTQPHRIVRLVKTEGKNRTFELEDGSVVVRSGGTASWRNNNPGNLKFEYADSADRTVRAHRPYGKALRTAQDRHDGVVALDQWGNAIFETPEAGRAAQLKLLRHRFGESSVKDMISRYSTADYSGATHHDAQLRTIYRTGEMRGFDLRHQKIGEMSEAELMALCEGISKFEGFRPGSTHLHVPSVNVTVAASAEGQARSHYRPRSFGADSASHAIYEEAALHFFSSPNRFEYGRPDAPRPGRDTSRLERDGDGDGRLGVDCSAFVWRGLKNAGFDVPGKNASNFTTQTLFNGTAPTHYARAHFDVIRADEARRPNGTLERGDLLLFSDGRSQHIGIFKTYDAQGRLHFIGSQGTSGPREVSIEPHGYWDGETTRIVGALRAKPGFQVRAPLHAIEAAGTRTATEASVHTPSASSSPASLHTSQTGGASLQPGDRGGRVEALQHTLNRLGVRDAQGLPLLEDGDFGRRTREAVEAFQREHALPGVGRVGPRTREALQSAHGLRITDPRHADYALFERTLGLVQSAEGARGIASGPHSANLAAALVVQMRRDGLQHVDRIDLSEPPRFARAVQVVPGAPPETERVSAPVDTRIASSQSLHASSDQLARLPQAPVAPKQADDHMRTQAIAPVH